MGFVSVEDKCIAVMGTLYNYCSFIDYNSRSMILCK